jgi:hypothetical protein
MAAQASPLPTFRTHHLRPTPLRVALIGGSDTTSTTKKDDLKIVDFKGNNDYWRLVDPHAFDVTRFHIPPNYFRAPYRWDFSQYEVVLNLITDPDQCPKTINIVERLTQALAHVVNRPRFMLMTTRDEIAKRLQGITQLDVPKVLLLKNPSPARVQTRIEEHGFRFPAILRKTGVHSGRIIGVINRAGDLPTVLGNRNGEYFLTEFVDFVSSDGLYRKMRLFFVGDQVLFKHLIVSNKWNIHARDRAGIMAERDELRREERDLLEGGFADLHRRLDPCLTEIRNRIKLDYFGLDCAATADGRLILFELNATMNFFPLPRDPRFAYLNACVEPAQAAMTRLLTSRSTRSRTQTAETQT